MQRGLLVVRKIIQMRESLERTTQQKTERRVFSFVVFSRQMRRLNK